jgi:ribose 5-phosphate isomerase B
VRIAIGSDMTGPLPEAVVEALRSAGHELAVMGPLADGSDEWADVGAMVGRTVAAEAADLGVLFCWSGTGVSIAANKVPGVRAALCGDPETARLARKHNHANVLVMSLRATSEQVGREILHSFLAEPYGEDDFDVRNVRTVDALD